MPAAAQLKPPVAGAGVVEGLAVAFGVDDVGALPLTFLGAGSSHATHLAWSSLLVTLHVPHVHDPAASSAGALMPAAAKSKHFETGGKAVTGRFLALAEANRSNLGSWSLLATLASRIACVWATDVGRGVGVDEKTKVKMGRRCLSFRAASCRGPDEPKKGTLVDVERLDEVAFLEGDFVFLGGEEGAFGMDVTKGAKEGGAWNVGVLPKAGDCRFLNTSSVSLVGDDVAISASFDELTFGGGAKWTTG